jgi:prepilin-type N-terminal cleavage/methylation domain-containing protein
VQGTRRQERAFTLIELLVVVSIVGILSTIAYVSFTKLQTSTETQTTIDKLVASIKAQRLYAMLGNSTTRTKAMPQGIYFEQGSGNYVLFSCEELQSCSYIPYQSSNVIETLDKSLFFASTSFPGNEIVFAPLSGEVANVQTSSNSIVIENIIDHTTKTIHISLVGSLEVSP